MFKRIFCSRSFEFRQNYVDRVRVGENCLNNINGPDRGSGWRQKSVSLIDLPTEKNSPHRRPRTNRLPDYNNNVDLQDYYSQIEPEKDYEDYYRENYDDKRFTDPFYRHLQVSNDNECSLRRTRSLAVIREETYNDLQISSINSARRSQLIPRAKLVNRSFFRDRFRRRQRKEEDSTGSGVDTQTSETRESDDYYAKLKRLDSVKIFPSTWQNDKSDLESINSDYFKDSSHQNKHSEKYKKQQQQRVGDKGSRRSRNKFKVLEIEIHHDNSQSSAFPETTTSSDQSDTCSNYDPEEQKINLSANFEEDEKSESIENKEENNNLISEEDRVSSGTLTLRKSETDDSNLVISYGSVYLSSEDSSDDTIVEEDPIEDSISNPSIIEANSESEISVEDIRSEHCKLVTKAEQELEKLYSQVRKGSNSVTKPRILGLEKKIPKSASTNSSCHKEETKRGTLERLTCISTSQILKTNEVHVIDAFRPNLVDYQYFSLPDVNIGRSLKVSERIDAKLRSSYNHEEDCEEDLKETQNKIYDSITHFGRTHKRARQRELSEIDTISKHDIPKFEVTEYISTYCTPETFEENPFKAENIETHCPLEDITVGNIQEDNSSYKETDLKQELANKLSHDETETVSTRSDFKINQTTNNFPGQFRIIVTDAQDNIIEEDSIESSLLNNNQNESEVNLEDPDLIKNLKDIGHQTEKFHKKTIKEVSSKILKESKKKIAYVTTVDPKKDLEKNKSIIEPNCENIPKPAGISEIFRAKPVKTHSNDHIKSSTKPKMSRPQILHVVDSKRCHETTKEEEEGVEKEVVKVKVEKEFLEKVDSVRCYWSKLIQEEKNSSPELGANKEDANFVTSIEDETTDGIAATNLIEKLPKITQHLPSNNDFQSFSPTIEIVELNGQKQATIVKAHNLEEPDFDHVRYKVIKSDLFQKNILARSKKEAQFDGLIQYLQDYSFQELLNNNNVVIIEPVRTKIEQPSEAPAKQHTVNCKITGGSGAEQKTSNTKRHFFYHPVRVNRELLEEELPNPDTVRNVRKFFEESWIRKQPNSKGKPRVSEPGVCGEGGCGGGGIKRRSLRYLTIDTSYGNGNGLRKWDSASLSSGISSGDLSSPCECSEPDSREGNGDGSHTKIINNRHTEEDVYSSEENLCDDDEICDTYYVSEDVLEKIRECGSTVTYYGGRVLNNKSPELSPMTKAIIEEIRGNDVKCNACQPNNCPHFKDLTKNFNDGSQMGVKFKLIKSNSCSSRLELVGTEKSDTQLGPQSHLISQNRSPSPHNEAEESVRELVNRLESGTMNNSSVPRIIESKCIEKTTAINCSNNLSCSHESKSEEEDLPLTINNHLIGSNGERMGPVDIINHVTVNNHISFSSHPANAKTLTFDSSSAATTADEINNQSSLTQQTPDITVGIKSVKAGLNKVCRNKNVDLAFNMTKCGHGNNTTPNSNNNNTTTSSSKSVTKDRENDVRKMVSFLDDDNLVDKKNYPENDFETSFRITRTSTTTPLQRTNIISYGNSTTPRNSSSTPGMDNNKIHSNSHKIEHHIQEMPSDSIQDPILVQAINNDSNFTSTKTEGSEILKTNDDLYRTNLQRPPKPEVVGSRDRLYEKHYVANDKKLVEGRKYDEIEFEEFEVYNPDKSVQTQAKGSHGTNSVHSNGATQHLEDSNSEDCFDSLDDRL